jgi:hypothetical protein
MSRNLCGMKCLFRLSGNPARINFAELPDKQNRGVLGSPAKNRYNRAYRPFFDRFEVKNHDIHINPYPVRL